MRLLHPPHHKLLMCNFCDSTYADFNFLDTHVATHMIEIGQAFLDNMWRNFEADPGASLGIWQQRPAELDSSPEPPQAKSNPPPKEQFPYGSLFPRVGIEGSVPKARPQRAKTPHQELFSLITPPPVPEAPKVVSPPRTKTPHQDSFSPITPMDSIPESPKVVSPLRARTPHHHLVSPTTPKEPVPISPEIASPKKEKVPDVALSPPAKLKDTVPELSASVSPNPPETPPPPKPSFKQIGMAMVEAVMKVTRMSQKRLLKGRKYVMQSKAQEVAQAWDRDGWEHPQVDNKHRGLGLRLLVAKAQHLGRRHKRSRRCNRCWKAFESDAKARTHESLAGCDRMSLSDFERFMDTAYESITERFATPMSDLDGWWFIFRLLIPGMQDLDLQSLKRDYSPYYGHQAPAIMLPAMNFPVSLLDTVPSQNTLAPLDVL
ncbi:hypothetical protein CDV36_015800 [Fusarium kuroshium]|uniref:C2H2-type domain-containing protein n=1 Tax=Fusarium kuroshium TaxID=2010991 RepID=A0A3M2R8H2_9HYPO|nr:hypothetical protein CDV36_015800 [Fusarium kuroshium]